MPLTKKRSSKVGPSALEERRRIAKLVTPKAVRKPGSTTTYLLRVRCRNCLHVWHEELKREVAWQDAVNMHDVRIQRVPARAGVYCDRFHPTLGDEGSTGVFCEECKFREVSCPNCESTNIGKEPMPTREFQREWDVTHVQYSPRCGDKASTGALVKALSLHSEAGNTIDLIAKWKTDELIIVAHKDVPE